ncbi:MAG: secretion system protein [Wolbachia endosymbiont of Meromenopon meropis]|nr:secretion system protein [Wolbachia endosymbiont of Meromenopon meropis]
MKRLKYSIFLFIVFCTYMPIRECIAQMDDENRFDIDCLNSSKQCGGKIFLLESDESVVPDNVPLPVKFPDFTISNQLISINIGEEISVKDLLVEIGKLSDIDLDVDPKISGNIILKLKDRSITEVIQSIADSAKLRCLVNNGTIRIEQDLPYIKNYYLDFTNNQNTIQNGNAITSNIITSNEINNDKVDNGIIRSQYINHLWNSLEKGLSAIININGINNGEFFSSNREAGILILNAREDIHKVAKEYINKVKQLAFSQVMIDAKIVEVVLNDKYLSGINLDDLYDKVKYTMDYNSSTVDLAMNFGAVDLESLVKSLDMFGTSTVILSSRVHAMNNQQAMISFIKNHIYFTHETQKKDNDILTTKMNNVSTGVVLIMHPNINIDTGEILINVHSTLSSIDDYAMDPGIEYTAQRNKLKLNSNVPIIETREINSALKIKSGEIMMIGGIIKHREDKKSFKATKLHQRSKEKLVDNVKMVETFIFFKATILSASLC